MLDRAVLSVLGLFAGVLASTVTPARGQNEGQRYFRNAGWTVESLVAAVLIWTIASGIERADAQTNTSLFFQGHNWKVEAVFSDGQRPVCVATTRSLDGGTFALTATIDREWRAIFRPGEGFEPKRKRTMTMSVDGTKIARAESIVAQDGYASGGLLNGMALGQVRNGQALEVETVLGRSEISLTGSAEAVLQIEKCLGQLTQFAAQSPDGVAQRRVPTQSIGPQGMPQGAIGQFPGRMVDPPRQPTPAEMEAYGARRQGAPLPAPVAPQQAPPAQSGARRGPSDAEIDTLTKMAFSRDPATRAAGLQMLQQYQQIFGPRSEEQKADLEYKRALTACRTLACECDSGKHDPICFD